MAHRIGLVGLGAIAMKQHVPAIAANPAFSLVASASLAGELAGVPVYRDHRAMLAAHPEIEAVVVCTPPGPRLAVAADVLLAGRHVLVEKPPAASLGAAEHLVRLAAAQGRVLHTAWHSQYNAAVARAADLLAGKQVARLRIDWKEDFYKYHPGQDWIWQAGGFGVFDMGINGFSILSRILDPLPFVVAAELGMPAGADTAISATLRFAVDGGAADMAGDFDWDWREADLREIRLATTDGMAVALTDSGGTLTVDGVVEVAQKRVEYRDIYRHFDTLLREGKSCIDLAPLRLVADALLVARLRPVGPVRA